MANLKLSNRPDYDEIIEFLSRYLDKLSYRELLEALVQFYDCDIAQETLIVHLRENGLKKNPDRKKLRVKHIKGLREFSDRELLKLKKLKGEYEQRNTQEKE